MIRTEVDTSRFQPLILRLDKDDRRQLHEAMVDVVFCAVAHTVEGRGVQLVTGYPEDQKNTLLVRLDVVPGPAMGYLLTGEYDLRLPREAAAAHPFAGYPAAAFPSFVPPHTPPPPDPDAP